MGIFLDDINKFIDDSIRKQDNIVREIVREVIESPIYLSPIDTGNFVSNWLLGIDDNIPWGVTGFKNPDKDFNAHRVTARIPLDAAYHSYTLVNNTKYAQALEDGHSRTQAPLGMIAITELRIPEIVRRVVASYS